MPVLLDVSIPIGSTGAVGTISGKGVASVTRLAAGIYRIRLQDNYSGLFHIEASLRAPVSGSDVASGSLVTGTTYQITAVGTSVWATAGLPASLTAAVGQVFTAVGTVSGTGTAKALGVSGIQCVENLGGATMLSQSSQSPLGGFLVIKCLGATSSSVTTLIAADPADGSVLSVRMHLNNSSIQ